MWLWLQKTGELLHNGVRVGQGYSGFEDGCNNPDMQDQKSKGPIPCGTWDIYAPFSHATKGPYVMRLLPRKETKAFGRRGFLIHGDSIRNPGTASLGCIILSRALRMRIWESGDHELLVLSGVDTSRDPG